MVAILWNTAITGGLRMKGRITCIIIRIFKNILYVGTVLFIISVFIVHLFVSSWQKTEEGILPAKTAVILHAINHNIVTLDVKLPKFITKKGINQLNKEEIEIPTRDGEQIEALVYRPKKGDTFPIILYFHGGAFMDGYGNIKTHENIMRALALRTKSVVVGVGYRVAPAYTFPTAVEDGYDALQYVFHHAESFQGDRNRIAVIGDSAGGNIATVVAKMARDENGPKLASQVLFYPITTFLDEQFSSREKYASGYYLLSRAVMELARNSYAPEPSMWKNVYTSPLLADDLHNLPPTLIVTAEFDPLRDEGEEYGRKLSEHGVPVEILRFNGMMHGFISFYEVMRGSNFALNKTVAYLEQIFQNKVEEKPFEIIEYNIEEERFYLQEQIEAYIIAAALLGKQAISIIVQ